MCQLAAYVGDRPLARTLLDSLRAQEGYLGAHTAGIAALNAGGIDLVKGCGPVDEVINETDIDKLVGTAGIAHSRFNVWALKSPRYNTPGASHPWIDDTGKIAVMHNGDIKNCREHFERLRGDHVFQSYIEEFDYITDSEVALHMLSDSLAGGMSMEEAFRSITPHYVGGFLLSAIAPEHPETVWIANWFQPCVVAVGDDESMYCSSHIGFHDIRDELDRIFEPPKNSIIKLTRGKVEISPMDPGRKVPGLRFDSNLAAEKVLAALKERNELDFASIWDALYPEGLAECFGVSTERFKDLYQQGFRLVNEYIGVLDMLAAGGFVEERVDLRLEGGVPDTPRFSYRLV